MNTSVVEQSYWDEAYKSLSFHVIPPQDQVRKWIEQHVSKTQHGTCLEVGCFPGRYLAVFGLLGYELHGIDTTPRVSELKQWLLSLSFRTGEFRRLDFLKEEVPDRYDVICSFGFIEHFTNWEEVLQKHARMVKPGGTIIIETPNFRGTIQYFLHRLFDAENLARHHIPAMNPEKWKQTLLQEGFEVKWYGHFGAFDFWTDTKHYTALQKAGLKIFALCKPLLRILPKGWKSSAPYCGIVATKKNLQH